MTGRARSRGSRHMIVALLLDNPRMSGSRPRHLIVRLLAFALLICGSVPVVRAGAGPDDLQVTPGEFVIEHPTLINLGFEWHIDGDANRNARVEVSFRKQGETTWRTGMPLLRLHGEQVFWRNIFNLVVPNMFAGSILDLEPDTAYEARFVLTDPDGVAGPLRQRDQGRHGADPAGADAGHGRQGVPRLPGEMARAEDRAGVRRHHVRLQLLLRRRRHRAGRAPARQAGRHRPRARRALRLSLRVLRQPDHRQRHDDVRGDVLPDGGRHGGEADRDQGGG